MSDGKGSKWKGLFALIIAPLIVTVISGLIFEWYRGRANNEQPIAVAAGPGAGATISATAPAKNVSPVAMMIIGKWNVVKNSTVYGEKSVEFTANGQMIRTTSAIIRGDNSTNYKYSVNESGDLIVPEGGADLKLIKLTDDELTLSWSGSLSSYTRPWPDWLRAVAIGGAVFLCIVVSLVYHWGKRR